jgi:D-arabinose 5-phosphate isomerase GutQ
MRRCSNSTSMVSYIPGDNFAGWCVIMQDHHGEVIAAKVGRSEHVSNAFHVELCVVVQLEALGATRLIQNC